MPEGIEIFYDGECPVCRSLVMMIRLRQAVGPVAVIDARSDDPRLAPIHAAGLDLNQGMVVRHGDRLWHGAEAMQLLAMLSARPGPLRWMMASPRRARAVYPWLSAGRGLLLRLLGRKPIAVDQRPDRAAASSSGDSGSPAPSETTQASITSRDEAGS